jgi:hypothetical protein
LAVLALPERATLLDRQAPAIDQIVEKRINECDADFRIVACMSCFIR